MSQQEEHEKKKSKPPKMTESGRISKTFGSRRVSKNVPVSGHLRDAEGQFSIQFNTPFDAKNIISLTSTDKLEKFVTNHQAKLNGLPASSLLLDPPRKSSGGYLYDHKNYNKAALDRVAMKIKRYAPTRKERKTIKNEKGPVTKLRRGGVHVQTSLGPVQFGMPPETIKDVLSEGLQTVQFYVVPKERFNLRLGVSCAEIEFPMFFSFFILKKVLILITDEETKKEIEIIHQESTTGPAHQDDLFADLEFAESVQDVIPDHIKEIGHFKVPGEMIRYIHFDEKHFATLKQGPDEIVLIHDNEQNVCFEVFDYHHFKKNSDLFKYFTQRLQPKSIIDFFFKLKSSGLWVELRDCFHVISYDDAERIGNLYEPEEKHEVQPVDVADEEDDDFDEEYGLKTEDFASARNEEIIRSRAGALRSAPSTDFKVPQFGITILGNSHGFDYKGTTTGFVVWINGQGVIVDPPPHSSFVLEQYGIRPKTITAIILTHCHADHDAGTFQKILTDHRVDIMTSATIYESFLRKYSAVSGLGTDFLRDLCTFKPVYLGEPHYWKGAEFKFFYSLHSIPCVGFRIDFKKKSMVYSADTYYDREGIRKLQEKDILSEGRAHSLLNFPWDCDVILHEAGVPPIHTPVKSFLELEKSQQERIHLVHIAGNEAKLAIDCGLKIAQPGVENSLILIPHAGSENQMMKWLQVVSSMEVFEHFSVDRALEMVFMAEFKTYAKGTIIKESRVSLDKFMIIVSGVGEARIQMEKFNCIRILKEGDYFGEMMFYKEMLKAEEKRRVEEVARGRFSGEDSYEEAGEPDTTEARSEVKAFAKLPSVDEQSSSNLNRVKVIDDESFEAISDMEILELNYYKIKNLVVQDLQLTKKMSDIVMSRGDSYAWTAIESNSILTKLRLAQKLQLQGMMKCYRLNRNDEVYQLVENVTKQVWKKGAPINFAILVSIGELSIDEVASDTYSHFDSPLIRSGMLVFEFLASQQGIEGNSQGFQSNKHQFTLRCHSDFAYVYTIDAEQFRNFLYINPHLMLSFFKSEVVY